MEPKYEVFLSHAGEDKDTLAILIYNGLKKRGISVFLDRPELRVGGDAVREMEKAMETARIALFILSPEFALKEWPIRELCCFLRRAGLIGVHSGTSGETPILIPVFYRLTVAETRYRMAFSKYESDYAELSMRFRERVREKKVSEDDILNSLTMLSQRTGVENVEEATNEGGDKMTERRCKLAERICEKISGVISEQFPSPCNVPANNEEVVMDFGDCASEEVQSYEARVLREIVRDGVVDEKGNVIAVKGGAGVGKSCILRAVGGREEVRQHFRGGVYLLSLGMDATIETLIGEMLKMLRACGRVETAGKLRGERNVEVVLESVRDAIRGRKCLILVDDLWERHMLGPGTVEQMYKTLGKGSASVLVITTRNASVALKGKVLVDILPREPMSDEAERILLAHARVNAGTINAEVRAVSNDLLRLCGGLPACLAIMGRGLGELFLKVKSTAVNVWERYHGMMKKGEKLVRKSVDEYKDLITTLSVALLVLEECRGKYEQMGGRLCWRDMHQSFCVMKKQSVVNVAVFTRLWGLDSDDETWFVINAFADLGLANIELGGRDEKEGVRLHDLTHDFSVACAKSEGKLSVWHRRVLEGYISAEDRVGTVRQWWDVEEDGYILENISRHLVRSECLEELIELVLNGRWTKVRAKQGGLLGWIMDFSYCLEGIELSREFSTAEKEELRRGLAMVRDSIGEGWSFISGNLRELGFQAYMRLLGLKGWPVQKYLESVALAQRKPWLEPMGRYWDHVGVGKGGDYAMSDFVRDVALHEKGQFAVAGVGNDVVIIDLAGRQVLKSFTGHKVFVCSVGINRGGTRAFSWSPDGAICQWDIETGDKVSSLKLNDCAANVGEKKTTFYCGTLSSDCRLVATGSSTGMVELWDTRSGERMGKPMGGFHGIASCVSVSLDGRRIAAGGSDGTLRFWDVATCAQVGYVLMSHAGEILCVALSSTGRYAISSSRGAWTIRVWDVTKGTQLGGPISVDKGVVTCVRFSSSDHRFVTGEFENLVRVFDTHNGAQVGHSLSGHTNSIESVAISEDGALVLSGGYDKTLRVWDLSASSDEQEEPEHMIMTTCLGASADGQFFVSGSEDGALHIWDGATGERDGRALLKHEDGVSCVAVGPRGEYIVSGSWDKSIRVWNTRTRSQLGQALLGHTEKVRCISLSPDGRSIVSGSCDKTIRIWSVDVALGKIQRERSGTSAHGVIKEALSMVKSIFSKAKVTANARLNSTASRRHAAREHRAVLPCAVSCVRVCADGERILCGLWDGRICVWDITRGRIVSWAQRRHRVKIGRLEMLPDNEVRSFSWDGGVMRWRLDDDMGLVEMPANNAQFGNGRTTDEYAMIRQNEFICLGRHVQVGIDGERLATLPGTVRGGVWHYNESSGILAANLRDGRLLFFKVRL